MRFASLFRPVVWLTLVCSLMATAALAPVRASASDPEPNNTVASATAITPGLAGRTGALSSASDVDVFSFRVGESGVYTVELFNTSVALDGACLSWRNGADRELAQSCVGSGHTVARLEVREAVGTTQYIHVSHPLGRTGSYSLRVLAPTTGWTPDSEPNNSLSTASPLTAQRWSIQTLHGLNSSLAQEGSDVDVFKVSTVAGQGYTISTTNLASSLQRDLTLKVYDPAGRLLRSSAPCRPVTGGTTAERAICHETSVTAPATTLYVLVTGTTKSVSGQYLVCAAATGTGCSLGPINQFGDMDSNGTPDLLTTHTDGSLQLYGTLGTTLSAPRQVGRGWQDFTWMSYVADTNGDGRTDLIGRRKDGTLWFYSGLGQGRFSRGTQVGHGWNGMSLMTVMRDFTGDGRPELVARSSTGHLIRYSFAAGDSYLTDAKVIGRNWQGIRATATVDDFSGDGHPDLLGIAANGDLIRYAMRYGVVVQTTKVGQNWGEMGLLTSPGDLTNDKLRDLVALRSDGTVWVYVNRGKSWRAGEQLGSGLTSVVLMA